MKSDVRNAMYRARVRSAEAVALAEYRLDRKHYLEGRGSDNDSLLRRRLVDALMSRSRWSALREVMDSAELAGRLVNAA